MYPFRFLKPPSQLFPECSSKPFFSPFSHLPQAVGLMDPAGTRGRQEASGLTCPQSDPITSSRDSSVVSRPGTKTEGPCPAPTQPQEQRLSEDCPGSQEDPRSFVTTLSKLLETLLGVLSQLPLATEPPALGRTWHFSPTQGLRGPEVA